MLSLVWQVLRLRQQLHASEQAAGEDLARALRRAAAAEGVLDRVRPTTAALRAARRAADGGRSQAEEALRAAASELRCLLGDGLSAPATTAVAVKRLSHRAARVRLVILCAEHTPLLAPRRYIPRSP